MLLEHIGDIIVCEPVIEWAREAHADALVVWLVKPAYQELLASHPALDAVVTVESLLSVAPIARSGVFDICVDLHVHRKPTEVPTIVHAKSWGDPTVTASNYFRHGSILRSLTKGAGITIPARGPRMYIPQQVVASVDTLSLPERFVVIHATSNVDAKVWPSAMWDELLSNLLGRWSIDVIEVGLHTALSLAHPRVRSLCGRLSLLETSEIIRRGSFFIGIDSGPAHMANAWRRPALLLFGDYGQMGDWHPYDGLFADEADTFILRHRGPLRELDTSTVINRLEHNDYWLGAAGPEGLTE